MSFFDLYGGKESTTRNGVTQHHCGHVDCKWTFYVIDKSAASLAIGDIAYTDHIRDAHDSEMPLSSLLSDLLGGHR